MNPVIDIVTRMRMIADYYHNTVTKQIRKYSGEPYTVHTDAVKEIYATVFPDEFIGQAIAHGHDLFEDTKLTPEVLTDTLLMLGYHEETVASVVGGIVDLTDVFVREKFPQMNRTTRKLNERNRLGGIPIRSKNVKLSDLIHNTADIVKNDPDFARVYLDEKAAILPLFRDANPILLDWAKRGLESGRTTLGLTGHKV